MSRINIAQAIAFNTALQAAKDIEQIEQIEQLIEQERTSSVKARMAIDNLIDAAPAIAAADATAPGAASTGVPAVVVPTSVTPAAVAPTAGASMAIGNPTDAALSTAAAGAVAAGVPDAGAATLDAVTTGTVVAGPAIAGPSNAAHVTLSASATNHQLPDLNISQDEMQLATDDDSTAVAAAPVHREFTCLNDEYSECRTGQYTMALSRKVISNHFGRNKACTRTITSWPLFCRKHYQRATYRPDQWQKRKIFLIERQLNIIEREFPGTKYEIALKKSEADRLNEFTRLHSNGMPKLDALALFPVPEKSKAFHAPMAVLDELSYYIGKNRSVFEVKTCVSLILDFLRKGDCKEVPAIEFLPHFPQNGGGKGKGKGKAAADKTGSGPRTSPKGAVKKPGKAGKKA